MTDWGPPLEERFYRALKEGKAGHPVVQDLKKWFEKAWLRALKRFEDEQKKMEELTGREKE